MSVKTNIYDISDNDLLSLELKYKGNEEVLGLLEAIRHGKNVIESLEIEAEDM